MKAGRSPPHAAVTQLREKSALQLPRCFLRAAEVIPKYFQARDNEDHKLILKIQSLKGQRGEGSTDTSLGNERWSMVCTSGDSVQP